MSSGFAARRAAHIVLSDVLRRRRPLDAALHATTGLEPRDAGFARAIATETLRRMGQLDALIRQYVPKPPARNRAGPVPEILLAGACELLFLDVAPHAAVDGANQLAAADDRAVHFKPLINAVLRRVARDGADAIAGQDAARLNTPDWLWQRWSETFGEEVTRSIAAAHLPVPPLDVVVRSAVNIPDAEHIFGKVWRLKRHARIETLSGYAEGAFWVQDAAATLPVLLLGEVRGATVIDLCAAPGGKTAQLASAGAQVIAVEREAARMDELKSNLARLKLQAECVVADARDWRPREAAPLVLLDAPCTATGTVRRHPELPWIKNTADVTLVAQAAGELIDAAAEMTARGGTLVFAVCSLEREEGPEQVEAFLQHHPEFKRAPLDTADVFGHREWIDAAGDLRTLPCHLSDRGGMDGFYAARLRRNG